MKLNLLFAAACVLCVSYVAEGRKVKEIPGCPVGSTKIENKFKYVCEKDAVRPIACVPAGGKEYPPTETWADKNFKYQCKQVDQLSLAFDIIACLAPNGSEIPVGGNFVSEQYGVYSCDRAADGSVTRHHESGCIFHNTYHKVGATWSEGGFSFTCEAGARGYQAKAKGCLVDGNIFVALGNYTEYQGKYYRCDAGAGGVETAQLIVMSREEFVQWSSGFAEGEEAVAEGGLGSGFKQETTEEPTTTTTTTTEAPPTTTTTTTTTTIATTTRKPTMKPIPCVDTHPECKALCAKSCIVAHLHGAEEKPVGLQGDKRGLFSFLGFGSGSHEYKPMKGPLPNSRPIPQALLNPKPVQQCGAVTALVQDILNAFCPKSCGVCDRACKDNSPAAAVEFQRLALQISGATCNGPIEQPATNVNSHIVQQNEHHNTHEESVGLSLSGK